MVDKERMLKLLGNGLQPLVVANTLGCDPSYVSQALMDEDFKGRVLALRMENLNAATTRDKLIDKIEDKLLDKLNDTVEYLIKPREILGAFNIVNAAKRRGAQVQGDVLIQNNIVSITLPPAAQEKFITNGQGEVVQVGARTTITMPFQKLLKDRIQSNASRQNSEGELLQSLGASE